jgi:co-chaperonin GroES (HSP10)
MKAINNYIIVEKIKQGPKKVGGLILTEDVDVDNRYIKAKVISTGNLVEGINNEDIVYYDKHAGHGVQYKDTLYHVIRSMDVVLIDT